MECHSRCPCSSSDVNAIIMGRKDSQMINKHKRKAIYAEIALFLSPEDCGKGKLVDLPSCIVQKVRDEYPDQKYSSYQRYTKHVNR
jgi:hypothetical protein